MDKLTKEIKAFYLEDLPNDMLHITGEDLQGKVLYDMILKQNSMEQKEFDKYLLERKGKEEFRDDIIGFSIGRILFK